MASLWHWQRSMHAAAIDSVESWTYQLSCALAISAEVVCTVFHDNMGVQGLWILLEPVGRRVNIEALTNKRLAVGERTGSSTILYLKHWSLSASSLFVLRADPQRCCAPHGSRECSGLRSATAVTAEPGLAESFKLLD